MKDIIGKAVVGMVPGAIASVIAIIVTMNYMNDMHRRRDASSSCDSKPCYTLLSERIAAIEATIQVTTDKRYRSTDAERDQRLMMVYVDKNDRALRDEMGRLRIELNKRIDTMHTRE